MNRLTDSAATDLTDSMSEKSITRHSMSGLVPNPWSANSSRTRFALASNRSSVRPSRTTFAPRFANEVAAAPPMDPVAPAIRMVRCMFLISIVSGGKDGTRDRAEWFAVICGDPSRKLEIRTGVGV